ncbi:CRISPR-associated helicase Cas3' [Marivita sp. GX14005]|uniref:CRISPR-associated helicase Cas3' n=1 Tax=Marivita sp. GX14005 TaxID=2942276 RepID=UPI002018FC45|nr:CRISPR-associated helicase Cas3' [Marivita sp. GX14005]MCL3883011.1 CRISPR-associated helicase Cas3' [Marivita sp. GX14005]
MEQILNDWPGKSSDTPGGPAHPAVYHMLDIAAVAEVLLESEAFSGDLRDAVVLFVALHDLGKIGAKFRAMIQTGAPQGAYRHWQVTEALLDHHRDKLFDRLGGDPDAHFQLYAATAGHHGRPPSANTEDLVDIAFDAGGKARSDSGAVIDAFFELWPRASLGGLSAHDAVALSWWVPGLVTAADWIGSNTQWFPACAPGPDPSAYLGLARKKARRAVAEAGLECPSLATEPLFDFPKPRPMQLACSEIAMPEGPMLAVIEDETGAGKTEAALMLAQRMMAAGKGRGLYIALPTMATADAMFGRAAEAIGRLYNGAPSLTLAHGRSGLSKAFADLVGRDASGSGGPACALWLADNRRRALLADVGVGTVDQALLGVLPTKFSTLRLYGLSSKILIIDEVHETGDPYMTEEVVRLLQAHRMAGGSAILLTATLPLALRARLMSTYGGVESDPAFPALSIAGGTARRDFPQETGPRGPVQIQRMSSAGETVAYLAEAARMGAACVWVRNAVDDAIAGAEALRAAGVEADLLHARFALIDRKRLEEEALERFGKNRADRPGRVLVATQVVESSLDLDFDVMVSDLAPVAALVQRAGRLWRHMDRRPAKTRPVAAPVLHVLAPDPEKVDSPHWLSQVLEGGAWTYNAAVQWRSAKAIFEAGEIRAPSGLRALIEAGEADCPVPEPIEAAESERRGAGFAQANHARQNLVSLEDGFRAAAAGAADTDYPTRLGQPQRILLLVRWQDGALAPWAEDASLGALPLSEVQASERRLAALDLPDQTDSAIAALSADWPDWKHNSVTICPVAQDGTICEGLRYDKDAGLLFF